MSRRDRLLAAVVPVMLAGVALIQISLALTSGMSPWRGGGFGMFSGPDAAHFRALHTAFQTDGGEFVPIDVASLLAAGDRRSSRAFANAKGFADQRRVNRWTERILEADWIVRDGVAEFGGWRDSSGRDDGFLVGYPADSQATITVVAVVTDVWRPTYDPTRQAAVPDLVSRYVVPVDHEGGG